MKNYKTEEPLATPYRRARQQIDDRIGSSRVQAHNWRRAALAAMLVSLVAVAGLIFQSSKASVIPYLIEVDGDNTVRLVGAANEQKWVPSEGVKRHFLEEWIMNIREISSDREVLRQKLLSAYDAVSGTAKAQLDTMVDETGPFEKLGKETRQLEMSTINKVSEDSYRIEWVEIVFNKAGYISRSEKYVGLIELRHKKPKTRDEMERNPLGIYVVHFSINQRAANAGRANKNTNSQGGDK